MTETNGARNGFAQDEHDVHLCDAVVVGAGFAGLYMLHRLRGLGLSVRVFEAGAGVGGTWYWNRYPGARCDAESLFYSYSFSEEIEREFEWTERYARQPEILSYINFVADRLDLRRDITFETRVTAARWDEATLRWQVSTDRGENLSARFLITAIGCLSAGRIPDIAGRDEFKGRQFHTGTWPHEPVDFGRERVGVIGTGSSGIQLIAAIAPSVSHLTVFQRTPNFSVPAVNKPLQPHEVADVKARYATMRGLARSGHLSTAGDALFLPERLGPAGPKALDVDETARRALFQERWDNGGAYFVTTFGDLMIDPDANKTAADFVRDKIRATVADPETAAKLCPTDHPLGSKRICVDTDYYATYNRPNVDLIDISSDPIDRITPDGLRLRSGHEIPLDSIVFATGFDAITGPLLNIDLVGRDGVRLADKWKDGPSTYLGLSMAGFPNLFTITGPLSPSVLSNVVVSIEQHVDWIADCLSFLQTNDVRTIEAEAEAETAWRERVLAIADATLFSKGKSWYNGSNIPGKPRCFLAYAGGVGAYRTICDEVVSANYSGFVLS